MGFLIKPFWGHCRILDMQLSNISSGTIHLHWLCWEHMPLKINRTVVLGYNEMRNKKLNFDILENQVKHLCITSVVYITHIPFREKDWSHVEKFGKAGSRQNPVHGLINGEFSYYTRIHWLPANLYQKFACDRLSAYVFHLFIFALFLSSLSEIWNYSIFNCKDLF